jgi:quinoprotein glucose dehydrogenase
MSDGQGGAGRIVLRLYALVILAIGIALAGGGAYLVSLGGSPYYVLTGAALIAGAVLLWTYRAEGAFLYGLMLLATLTWSIWESGDDGWALMPRVVAPAVLGLVLLLPFVRRALVRRNGAWSARRCGGAVVLAVAVGAALRLWVPPRIPADPLYQAGTTTAQAPSAAAPDTGNGDWLHYGNDAGGTRFSPLTQIDASNVDKLELAWSVRIGTPATARTDLQVTPLKVGRTVYVCDAHNNIVALDAENGAQRWRFDSGITEKVLAPHCRGLVYYKAPEITGACAERIITNTVAAQLIAVDAQDGKRCQDFGTDGEVSLLTGLGEVIKGYYYPTSAPQLVHGKVVVGARIADNQMVGEPSGVIRAYDAVTGKLAWAWDMGVPDRTGAPAEGEEYTRGTPNSWGPMSADEALGLVYVPTGNATPDYFGAHRRPFDEQYAAAVVALDAETGRPRWHFQTVHHDIWDLDVAHQPTFVDFRKGDARNGEVVHALVLPTKRGELFVLDRATGTPVYPVEERPVPQEGRVPEERLSPTQPFSVGLPSFRGADLVEARMWGITPLDQLWCRIKFKQANYEGTLTPTSLSPVVQYPGYAGGMEWGSATVDTSRHIVLVNTNYVPIYTQLLTRAEAERRGYVPYKPGQAINARPLAEAASAAQMGTPYGIATGPFLSPLDVPCNQPPYGRLSAVDLTSGKLIWSERFGTARHSGPWGIRSMLPFVIGTPNIGGGVATQSGLYFIGATQDGFLRAFATATGKQVWQASLPTAAIATPITYMSPDSGRQFVVVAAGGGYMVGAQPGDYIVAYALPKAAK